MTLILHQNANTMRPASISYIMFIGTFYVDGVKSCLLFHARISGFTGGIMSLCHDTLSSSSMKCQGADYMVILFITFQLITL